MQSNGSQIIQNEPVKPPNVGENATESSFVIVTASDIWKDAVPDPNMPSSGEQPILAAMQNNKRSAITRTSKHAANIIGNIELPAVIKR
ncbi:MAG: hypothetical protein C5B60_02495 [Chloroflexi bacterium]|nr:MAG: hypothetical protein C5B60_02495 [Chloroflexota bacterium]